MFKKQTEIVLYIVLPCYNKCGKFFVGVVLIVFIQNALLLNKALHQGVVTCELDK